MKGEAPLTPLEAARHWRALGIAVIPVLYRDKRPVVAWNTYRRRLPTDDELRLFFGNGPRNIALVCGWEGLTVIDFDDLAVYGAWCEWATAVGGIAAEIAELSYSVATSRGRHVYVALDDPPEGTLRLVGLDVKAAGGYVLAPPSVHPSGHVYAAVGVEGDASSPRPIIRAATRADVLPAELLATAEPPAPSRRVLEVATDPWQAAMSPAVAANGNGLVASIKAGLDLLDLLPPIEERRAGYAWTRCPLHDDHDPSLSVDLKTQQAKCWAGCTRGRWYDAIDMYAALRSISNAEAIKALVNGGT